MSKGNAWQTVLECMLKELRSGEPRAEAYWAQQLAFAPVLVHAVALAVRGGVLGNDDRKLLRDVVPLALAMLGPLPDGCDGDPAALFLLARRQAEVLAWGRRRHLCRLAVRLGHDGLNPQVSPVPRRFLRPYPLLGWHPLDAS